MYLARVESTGRRVDRNRARWGGGSWTGGWERAGSVDVPAWFSVSRCGVVNGLGDLYTAPRSELRCVVRTVGGLCAVGRERDLFDVRD